MKIGTLSNYIESTREDIFILHKVMIPFKVEDLTMKNKGNLIFDPGPPPLALNCISYIDFNVFTDTS